MKRHLAFLFLFLFLFPTILISQSNMLLRVEPPFWWTGMSNPNLQVLIYGNEISLSAIEINHPGIELKKIHKVENPNYLFIDLTISEEVQPGSFDIMFKVGNKLMAPYKYELKERKTGSSERKGFDNSDAIYLLMPDRFSNGDPSNDNMPGMIEKADRNNPDGRHGGDISGIVNHLNYIKNLGFTTIWCNPLLENNYPKYSYHGYAITDFYNIDRRFGTNSDYVQLVQQAHDLNLKVIMDMVFNHCCINNWFILDPPQDDWFHQFPEFTKSNFRASTISDPYASEYDRTKLLTGWFDTHMADLNQTNPFLSNYLIQNTIWWIEYSGIDGIRVDTQPYSYKEFITEWSKAVFDEYPNFNILGESWLQKESITAYFQKDAINRDSYNSNIPSVTDFPTYYAITSAFNEKDAWTEGLARLYYVLTQDFLYANPEQNLIFCDNHDLNRYYTSLGEDLNKWKMGITYLLTTRGIPMINYGTEILMTGEKEQGDGFIRKDFPGGWAEDQANAFTIEGRTNDQNEAYNFLQKLLKWRQSKDVLHHGKLTHFVPENETYVYFRHNESECIMVALNNSTNEMKALKMDRFAECVKNYAYAINVITDETVNYLDAITIPPKSVIILELKR
jgi:glycosidase